MEGSGKGRGMQTGYESATAAPALSLSPTFHSRLGLVSSLGSAHWACVCTTMLWGGAGREQRG